MNKSTVKKKYNYKNIASALAVLLIIILIITTACHRNAQQKKENSKAQSKVTISSKTDSNSKTKNSVKLTKNYKYLSLENKSELCKGSLALVDSNHAFKGQADNLDTIYSYLFDDDGTQIAYASGSEITANKDTLKCFNKMAVDFYNETGLASLLINSAYSTGSIGSASTNSNDSESDEKSSEAEKAENDENDESATGYVIDLLTYDQSTGTYPEFTGKDKYKWVLDNCYKYGFIQSDSEKNPGRFRFVGKVNAEIMHNNNLSLEKYNEYIKKYSFEKPLSFTDSEDNSYLLYYIKSEKGDKTKVPIAQKDNGSDYKYDLSGNNVDGYVVCIYYDCKEESQDSDDSSSMLDSSSESTETNESNEKIEFQEGTSSLDSLESQESVSSD